MFRPSFLNSAKERRQQKSANNEPLSCRLLKRRQMCWFALLLQCCCWLANEVTTRSEGTTKNTETLSYNTKTDKPLSKICQYFDYCFTDLRLYFINRFSFATDTDQRPIPASRCCCCAVFGKLNFMASHQPIH